MRARAVLGLISAAMALLMAAVAIADAAPWRARRRHGVRPNLIARARVAPTDWPAEPRSPREIDVDRFAQAFDDLCGWMPPGRPLRYADWIVRYSSEFEEDPFLVAALVYHQTIGTCRPDEVGENGELGLTRIRREMYADQFRAGVLDVKVRRGGQWVSEPLTLDRFPFAGPRLRRAEENIYFAAGLLAGWRRQHRSIDAAFEQQPHRHYVSHFIWGDRVWGDRDEDRIFTWRRALLEKYGAHAGPAPIVREGVTWGPPLDGAPRVISSGIGMSRDGGDRRHRGVDLESYPGETVRVIADGEVVFAGVDLPGRQVHEQLRPHQYDRYDDDELGAGGRFVCIRHLRSDGGEPFRSCYMHLEEVALQAQDQVRRGDVVGTVGRTGMQRSAAHLHLELHAPEELLDASVMLRGHIIGDPDPEL